MVPDKFNMVDMEGIDIIASQGEVVEGLYQKLVESITRCRYQCLYNWKFDGILIPPTYVEMDIEDDVVRINEGVSVDEEDVVRVYSLERPGNLLPIAISANGDYLPPEGYDGFDSVNVYIPPPVLDIIQITENGSYTPGQGVDGFAGVTVNVPTPEPVLSTLNVVANGSYSPPSGVDGFNSVVVNVPTGSTPVNESLVRNWDFTNPVNTRGNSSYSGAVVGINAWKGTSPTKCDVVTGGIKVSQIASGTRANLYNSFIIAADNLFAGKQLTLSVVINGTLYTSTFTGTTSSSQTEINVDGGYSDGGLTLWLNRDSSAHYAIGFYVTTNSPEYLISAIKLEYGDTQTLASVSGGVATLLSHQDIAVETFLGSSSSVSANW